MNEFLTKNADTALIEIKEKLYERLAYIRQTQHEFREKSYTDPVWEGIIAQCGSEERFLSKLLDIIDRS